MSQGKHKEIKNENYNQEIARVEVRLELQETKKQKQKNQKSP